MNLAVRIKARREEMGFSKAELGRAVGVTGQAVSLWEAGARSIQLDVLSRIADALKSSPVQLQGGSDVGQIDLERLTSALESLEAMDSVVLTARQRAKVIAYLYQRGGIAPSADIKALIKLAT